MAEVKTESIANGNFEKIKEANTETESLTAKVEKDAELVSDLESKIIEQIEYYFGDCNLPRDKFLQQQIRLDDGWVPLEVLTKFNRLAKLSTDLDVIATALKKSDKGLLQISEDNKKIRRNPSNALPEMNEARRQELMKQTLYVKGFPEAAQLDTLLEFFAKHVKVDQLIMRKYQDKAEKKWVFKGSVFAVFSSKEEAEKFLKLENLKYEDTDLIVKWQLDYGEEKKNERLKSKLESQNKKRKLKNNIKEVEQGGGDDDDEKKDALPKGAALYLSDCPAELTREEVKSKIEEFGIGVAYLYFSKGDTEGWVRLQDADSAAEVVKNLKDGKLELEEYSVSVRALEGEEETQFLERVKDDMSKRRNMNKNNRGRKGRGGGGGGGGNNHSFRRKRRGSPIQYNEKNRKKPALDVKSE